MTQEDQAREVRPLVMFDDSFDTPGFLDLRPKFVPEDLIQDETEEEEATDGDDEGDPKDSSVQEPVTSSESQTQTETD